MEASVELQKRWRKFCAVVKDAARTSWEAVAAPAGEEFQDSGHGELVLIIA